MKVGIIGAGAMGSLFSTFFSKAEISHSIFEIDKNIVKTIKKGLTLIQGKEIEKFYPVIDSNPSILSDADIIFVFVKSYSTEDAIKSVEPHIKKDSIIVSIQNGIGNFEAIKKFIKLKQIVYGVTTYGAAKENPSTVRFGGAGTIEFGGKSKEAINRLSSILTLAGLNFSVTETPEKSVWQKALINAGINPIASILNITNGEIVNNEFSKKLQENILREGVAAAKIARIKIIEDEIITTTADVCINTSANRCSMLQDIKAQRRTEIDFINGKIIEHAAKEKTKVPFNESVYYLIKAIEGKKFLI